MRPRKQKHMNERLADSRRFLWEAPGAQPIEGSRYFAGNPLEQRENEEIPPLPFAYPERPLWVEIGCGKGQMIYQLAQKYPEYNFLGLEREPKVLLTAIERAAGLERRTENQPVHGKSGLQNLSADLKPPDNLKFLMADADLLPLFFAPESVSCFYVTFSDPWPKKRHERRRLTHRERLKAYLRYLKPGGEIRFKSDNRELFLFSKEEFAAAAPPYFITENLHESSYAADNIQTEYEMFFSAKGNPIYAIYAKKDVTDGNFSCKQSLIHI